MSRVSRLCNNGYSWMPTSLLWNSKILWRFKYEGRAGNTLTFGWETSPEWGYGRRKECKDDASRPSISKPFVLLYFFMVLFSIFTFSWSGSSSLTWNQRTLLVGKTNCSHCNFSSQVIHKLVFGFLKVSVYRLKLYIYLTPITRFWGGQGLGQETVS